jgi:hypothetical protein
MIGWIAGYGKQRSQTQDPMVSPCNITYGAIKLKSINKAVLPVNIMKTHWCIVTP